MAMWGSCRNRTLTCTWHGHVQVLHMAWHAQFLEISISLDLQTDLVSPGQRQTIVESLAHHGRAHVHTGTALCTQATACRVAGNPFSHALAHLKLIRVNSLSSLLLCLPAVPYGNSGCSGGSRMSSVLYMVDRGGVDLSSAYPYIARVSRMTFDLVDNKNLLTSPFPSL